VKTGTADLPLHGGRAPPWLFRRMATLSGLIGRFIVEEYGRDELLRRLADPCWFQALSCVIGFDWHSSGTTTVTTAALKEGLNPEETGIAVLGGKGRHSRRTPREIEELGNLFNLPGWKVRELQHASRMAAKVDSALIQDGYDLYHHAFILTEDGKWAVIQQGMNPENKYARRYHWLGGVECYVVEPHTGIAGVSGSTALDMTARESEGCRRASVDLVRDDPRRLERMFVSGRTRPLEHWFGETYMLMPWNVDWERLRMIYEFQPSNYEELVALRGVGPATVRALAYIAEVIYGERPAWRDPVKFSFALGGKDGVPRPVDRRAYDEAISFLKMTLETVDVDENVRRRALQRLRRLVPP